MEGDENQVTLSSTQFDQLADKITNDITSRLNIPQTPDVPAPVATPVPPAPVANPGVPSVEGAAPQQFDPEAIAKLVAAQLQSQSDSQLATMNNQLFQRDYDQVIAETPGLSSFLDAADDYGDNRKEKLFSITNPEERNKALTSLSKAYNEAAAGGSSARRSHVDPELTKRVEEQNKQYDAIDDKFMAGEISPEEHIAQSIAAISQELGGIQ